MTSRRSPRWLPLIPLLTLALATGLLVGGTFLIDLYMTGVDPQHDAAFPYLIITLLIYGGPLVLALLVTAVVGVARGPARSAGLSWAGAVILVVGAYLQFPAMVFTSLEAGTRDGQWFAALVVVTALICMLPLVLCALLLRDRWTPVQ